MLAQSFARRALAEDARGGRSQEATRWMFLRKMAVCGSPVDMGKSGRVVWGKTTWHWDLPRDSQEASKVLRRKIKQEIMRKKMGLADSTALETETDASEFGCYRY